MKLIVNADDFGYSLGINQGIIEAYRNGVVTSTTLMVNMPGARDAFFLKKQYPELGVGIHMVLTCGKPMATKVHSLVGDDGFFKKGRDFLDLADPQEIRRELNLQFERFVEHGGLPTHIDSHHHVHAHEKVLPVVIELAKEHTLPVRIVPQWELLKAAGIYTTDSFAYSFYGELTTKAHFLDLLEKNSHFETVELMCHPGYVDEAVRVGSSYNDQRLQELQVLTDSTLKDELSMRKIELTHYCHLQG